jgi:hypothetical protein
VVTSKTQLLTSTREYRGEKHGDVLIGDPLPLSIGDQLDREFSSVGAKSGADKGVSIGE